MFPLTSECISPREGARLYLSSNHWDATKKCWIHNFIGQNQYNLLSEMLWLSKAWFGIKAWFKESKQKCNQGTACRIMAHHLLEPWCRSASTKHGIQHSNTYSSVDWLFNIPQVSCKLVLLIDLISNIFTPLNIQTVQVLHLRMPPQSIPSQWFHSVFCVLYTFVFELSFFASMQQSSPGCIPYLGRWGHPAERHSCHGRSNFPSFHLLLQDLQPGKSTQDALAQCHWRSSNQS